MRWGRGIVHAAVAVAYVGLLSAGLRLLMFARAETQRVGDLAHVRFTLLATAALGVLIAAFALWARRRLVAAAVAAALLTVPVVAVGPFQLFGTPRWLRDAWWALGFARDGTIVPLAWGAAVVTLLAAVVARGRRGTRRAAHLRT